VEKAALRVLEAVLVGVDGKLALLEDSMCAVSADIPASSCALVGELAGLSPLSVFVVSTDMTDSLRGGCAA
jgi:hypothetical protein